MKRVFPRASFTVMMVLAPVVSTGCRTSKVSDMSMSHSNQAGPHNSHRHGSGGDTQEYIARMEDPTRDVWQKPVQVVHALSLKAGERVADLGCGPGYFTIPLAKAVGTTGTVWAVDIEQAMLDRTQQQARASGLTNIRTVLCKENDPMLPAGQVDTIFIVNTYHHFPNRPEYLQKLRAALAPGGRIVNIDFVPKDRDVRGFGPPLEMQLSKEAVDREVASAGFQPVRTHEFLPEQYFVEYRLKAAAHP